MSEFASFDQIIAAGHPQLYRLAVLIGGAVGSLLIYRDSRQWALAPSIKRNIFIAVFGGGLIGCALPSFVAGDFIEWQATHFIIGPKTIIGGLLFGFLIVAAYKRLAGISFDTSDAFVRGTILMMAIGRLGCYAAHCCFGIPVTKWGVDMGDGIPRLPIQLIEATFLFATLGVFHFLQRKNMFPHRRLFLFFVVYGLSRFVSEYYRASVAIITFGIGFYQWLALLLVAVGLFQIMKRRKIYSAPVCHFSYEGISPVLNSRQILGKSVSTFHSGQLEQAQKGNGPREACWDVELGGTLLFNAAGLKLLSTSLAKYSGNASVLEIVLRAGKVSFDYYYSLGHQTAAPNLVFLPILARRRNAPGTRVEQLFIDLTSTSHELNYPSSLAPATRMMLPSALLIAYETEFDLLFANQIAVLNELERRVRQSLRSWIKSLWNRLSRDWRKNVVLNYQSVHLTAQIHPTAVVEGSIIGPHAEIGAHCVVRYSYIGENVTLHDGAKVELSVVGDHSWLMHDLVLVRSLTENHVFLIHGPYQFSYFQSSSSAFATILMDYRPDAKPIQVRTPHGIKNYGGRFLGSVLKEGAKVLGGTLLAPGRIVPENTWLGIPSDEIHLIENDNLPRDRALSPEETKRRSYESIVE